MSELKPVDGARWVPLTKGKYALVDDADYKMVMQYRWHCQDVSGGRLTYARRSFGFTRLENGKRRLNVQQMQALVLGVKTDKLNTVDHINGNTLDNRRANLRFCAQAENLRNSRARAVSGFRGVKYENPNWSAIYSRVWLGVYDTPEAAAYAVNCAILEAEDTFTPLNAVEPCDLFSHRKHGKDACSIGVCACGRKLGLNAMRPSRIAARGDKQPQCRICHCKAIAGRGAQATKKMWDKKCG